MRRLGKWLLFLGVVVPIIHLVWEYRRAIDTITDHTAKEQEQVINALVSQSLLVTQIGVAVAIVGILLWIAGVIRDHLRRNAKLPT